MTRPGSDDSDNGVWLERSSLAIVKLKVQSACGRSSGMSAESKASIEVQKVKLEKLGCPFIDKWLLVVTPLLCMFSLVF